MEALQRIGTIMGVPWFRACNTPNTAWLLGQLNAMGRARTVSSVSQWKMSVPRHLMGKSV